MRKKIQSEGKANFENQRLAFEYRYRGLDFMIPLHPLVVVLVVSLNIKVEIDKSMECDSEYTLRL